MNITEGIKKEIGEAICKLVSYTLKQCSICGKRMTAGRVIWNFRKPEKEKSIYIKGSIVCPECNEQYPEQVNNLKRGDVFNIDLFDV